MPDALVTAARRTSPIALLTAAEARVLGIRVPGPLHHRVRPGVYAVKDAWDALTPWDRYRARVHAYLCARPDDVLCLESAALMLGLPTFGETRNIHVFRPDTGTSRRFGDVIAHAGEARDVVKLDGIRVTSTLDTVIDLARVLPPAQGLAVADAAASPGRDGALTAQQAIERERDQTNPRGRPRARWVWRRMTGASESPGESISRAVIEWCGYEEPELQHEFAYEGHADRCDFLFASVGAIGESDGWGKYRMADPEEAASILRAEKLREDRLRRHGHTFARWDLADATAVTPLRRALDAAGVPRLRRSQPAMLATLRDGSRLVPRAKRAPRPADPR